MPIYQYDCDSCDRRVEIFFRSMKSTAEPRCPDCGNDDLRRVVSRVTHVRSSAERVGRIDLDQELGRLSGGDQGDFARWARKMGNEFDDELGSDFGELADRADAGDDPVERADPGHTLKHRINQAKDKLSESDA
tara:strand:- start:3202 stop:3603 length:402 start_codon:yes stop_codon:yes gene_type:complete